MPQITSDDIPGYAEAIVSWGIRSDSRATKYEVTLWSSGHISCDCPGWVFKKKDTFIKKGHQRYCKHVEAKWSEATQALRNPGSIKAVRVDDGEPEVQAVRSPKIKAPGSPDQVPARGMRAFEV